MNRRISVEMGRTIKTAEFENKRIRMGISEDIRDEDDIDECFDDIMNKLEELLDEEEAAILEEATKNG
jgi:hypothetical protein